MAMAVDGVFDLEFSGHSTTASSGDIAGNWSDWSPVVDWEALTTHHEDFHDWIESIDCMIEDEELNSNFNLTQNQSNETSNSVSVSTDTTAENDETFSDDSKGLRLIHLLLAAAEALAGENNSRDLARVILARLKEMVSPTDGTNMERLAAYFSDALYGLLEHSGKHHHRDDSHNHHHHRADVLAAFQLLQDMSPYVKFGHFTANQAILEAVAKDRRIHIVDYDIMDGIQWASLMQSLVSRKDGPPTPHLRITAVTRGGSSRRSIGTIQETGRRLAAFAASIGQPFTFHQCRLNPDETFRPASLKVVKGEALVINCMLHLPHSGYRAPDSIASFLSESKALNPRIVTLVEEEMGPVSERMFVERFMDYLQHYSALFDSLEAGFPMQSRARALVERVFLGPRISGSLGRIYGENGEEGSSWEEWLGVVGFAPVNISFANHCQAKLLLGLFNDGYRVEELSSNRLVLGWKSRRLLSASIWTSPPSDKCDL